MMVSTRSVGRGRTGDLLAPRPQGERERDCYGVRVSSQLRLACRAP
jgi:hypothetical protein